ncbi:MAG: type phosphodiesterase/nucleotide pyrophosphatase [Frankiales bacterium]|nr:type phosphodiesterase/nucleotide pyrophosphatase [Frankiales bacterium]
MPLPSRDFTPYVSAGDQADVRNRALQVLLSEDLAHIVDVVAWRDGEHVHVADSTGHSKLGRDGTTVVLDGVDPVSDQDPMSDTGYPYAALRLHSLFDEARAPDLAVVHTGRHHWPERGGHLGEHGSLNAIQSRAPLLLSGAGVTARGSLDLAVRTVDVGATLSFLAGGTYADMDGVPIDLVEATGGPVVGLLWDGAQCADLLSLAGCGALPNVARLLDRGVALRGGAIAEFPSVTLVNHTCALTGVGPGRHGIVNNAYFDRELGEQVVPNSNANWHRSMDWLRPGVETVFQRVPGRTACVNDPVDVGADYSTFDVIRSGGGATAMLATLPDPTTDPHTTQTYLSNADYAWGSQVDGAGLVQALDLWTEGEPPSLMWWNTTLTDSAHHAGGPGSDIARAGLHDADLRLGVWLDLLESRGLLTATTILLTADHGMEGADPSCTGDWDEALTAAGIPFRDEAYGFLYFGA